MRHVHSFMYIVFKATHECCMKMKGDAKGRTEGFRDIHYSKKSVEAASGTTLRRDATFDCDFWRRFSWIFLHTGNARRQDRVWPFIGVTLICNYTFFEAEGVGGNLL